MQLLNKQEIHEFQGIARILHHALFYDPSPAFIQDLIDHRVIQSWPNFTCSDLENRGKTLLSDYLTQWAPTQHQALKLDYGQLFYGPGEPSAAPWGSVYLSERQLLNDKSTMALKSFYQEQGIGFNLDNNQPVDHIGLFFAVLDQLLSQWAQAEESEIIKRNCFILLQQHLLPWSGRCLTLMQQHARTDFYLGIALLSQAYLDGLCQRLQLIPISARLYR